MKYLRIDIRIALTLTAPVWGAGCALAQSTAAEPAAAVVMPAQPDAEPSSGLRLLQSWELGLIASHGSYREPGFMQVQGPRLGLLAARELPTAGPWKLGLEGQWHGSAMQYSSPVSGELAGVPDHELDVRMTVKHALNLGQGDRLGDLRTATYVGLGYRAHYNDLRGNTSAGHVGYRRLNQRVYLPLGLEVGSRSFPAVTASIEYTPALYGSHTTFMTDVGGERDATVRQRSQGWGLQVAWQLSPDWRLSAFHRQWATQETGGWSTTISGVTQRYVEPKSRWRDSGLKLIRRF